MTYNVFGGTLSLTQSINQSCILSACRAMEHPWHSPVLVSDGYAGRYPAPARLKKFWVRCIRT